MKPVLHPWLATPEATSAAQKAVQIPMSLLPGLAGIVGPDELFSEALAILTECALPPRDQPPAECAHCGGTLEAVRKGAKFCSPHCRKSHAVNVQRSKGGTVARVRGGASAEALPPVTQAHVGSMHAWPESDRAKYAVREVGYALLNWLRTGRKGREVPASEHISNMNLPVSEADQDAREWLTDWLENHGVRVAGDESFEELAEAARNVKGTPHEVPGLAA